MTAKPLQGLAAIPLDEIHASPANPRDQLTGLEELASSIRENGLIQPLVVQKIPGQDGYQIVAGHRRHGALLLIGWSTAPCVVRRDMLPDEELLAMLVENGQRAGLDPIEEARALRRLKNEAGLSEAELARKIGRSALYVRTRLALLSLPIEDQEELRAGNFTITDALVSVRQDRAQQRRAAGVTGTIGRPKGRKTTPYFSDAHPLARLVRTTCDHKGKPKVGGVGCGECWENVIRGHERQHLADLAEVG